MEGIEHLGFWKPPKPYPYLWDGVCREFGMREAGFRTPATHHAIRSGQQYECYTDREEWEKISPCFWHRDDEGNERRVDHDMIIWSNVHPTEIRNPRTNEEFTPEPFEVVRFSNRTLLHRIPKIVWDWKSTRHEDRWWGRGTTPPL
jgi:hypothetical protein